MRWSIRNDIPILTVIALVLLCGVSPSSGSQKATNDQQSESTTIPESATPSRSIRLSEVIFESEKAERLAKQVDVDLTAAEFALRAFDPIDDSEQAIQSARKLFSGTESVEATLGQLMDLDAELKGVRERLDRSTENIKGLTEQLEGDLDLLQIKENLLADLIKSSTERDAPPDLSERGNSALNLLTESKGKLLPVRDRLLATLTGLSRQSLRIESLDADLLGRRSEIGHDLRGRSREPLWRTSNPQFGEAWTPARNALGAWISNNRHFVRQNLGEIVGSATLISVVMLRLFSRSTLLIREHLPYESIAEGTFRVMTRPLWANFLVVLLSLNFTLPSPPVAFYDFVWLLLLLPSVVLNQEIHGPHRWVSIWALGVAMLAFPLRTFIEQMPDIDRWIMALQALVMIMAIGWDWRQARLGMADAPVGGNLKLLAILVVSLLTASFCANLFGFTGTARMLVDGTLGSMGFAMVYKASLEVAFAIAIGFLETPLAKRSRIISKNPRIVAYWLRRQFTWLAAGFFGFSCLYAFRVQDEVIPMLLKVWETSFSVGLAIINVRSVAISLLFLLATWLLIRAARLVLEEELLPRLSLAPGVPFAVSTMVRYTLGLVGFILSMLALGVDLSKVTVLAGAIGVGVGFGLQNVVNNFISGIILLFEHPIHVGDVIELGNLRGAVNRIGIRSSTVRTSQGAEVIVPNADLISKELINWTLSDRRRRLEVSVGVAYGTDVEKVLSLLLAIAAESADTLDDPPPMAIFAGFGESSLDFQLYLWIAQYEDSLRVASDLRTSISRRLRDEQIDIPFPQRDVHIRAGNLESVAPA